MKGAIQFIKQTQRHFAADDCDATPAVFIARPVKNAIHTSKAHTATVLAKLHYHL